MTGDGAAASETADDYVIRGPRGEMTQYWYAETDTGGAQVGR